MGRIETIGDATLYLGDAREILPTISECRALITDAPYRVTSGGFGNLEGGFSGWIKDSYNNNGAIVTCDLDWPDWMPLAFKALSDEAHAYIFTNDRNLPRAWSAAEGAGFDFHRLLTWDKKTALPNRWYIQNCEFIWFGKKGRAYQINDCGSTALQRMFQRDDSEHPTEKPVPLCSLYVENSTSIGDVVLDPFMGSGTTGCAAVYLRRKFIGIEIEEKWFDVSCRRIERAVKSPQLFDAGPRMKQTDLLK